MSISQSMPFGKAYAYSAIGFLHAGTLVSSFIAFVCNESADWCRGRSYCSPPLYAVTYIYFSIIALGSFLSSSIMYILHCTAGYNKLPCSFQRKILGELFYMAVVVSLLMFGNLFMISRTGHRTIYMVSTFFGCLAMALFGIHLVLVFLQNYSLFNIGGTQADSIDDTNSNNPDWTPAGLDIHTTKILHFNKGKQSPANSSLPRTPANTSLPRSAASSQTGACMVNADSDFSGSSD